MDPDKNQQSGNTHDGNSSIASVSIRKRMNDANA